MLHLPLHRIIRISRPRFWVYLVGPFLIGSLLAHPWQTLFVSWEFWVFFLYFLFPANFFVYGVNDLYDEETDKNNPKKYTQETLMDSQEYESIKILISIVITLGTLLTLYFYKTSTASTLILFFFFSFFYSASPIRAKALPFVDTLFNILYVLPGIFGFLLFQDVSLLSLPLILASTFWCMAMHAYSAIPDQEADSNAHLHTTATVLGTHGTLLYCLALYVLAMILLWGAHVHLWYILLPYPLLMLHGVFFPNTIEKTYWWFPWINTSVGAFICLSLLL